MRKICLFVPDFQDLVLKQRIKERIAQIKEKHSISELPENYHEIDDLLQALTDHGLAPNEQQQQKTLR